MVLVNYSSPDLHVNIYSRFSNLAELLLFNLNMRLWANHLHYINHEEKHTPFPLFEEDEEQCDHHGAQTQTEHRLRHQQLKERDDHTMPGVTNPAAGGPLTSSVQLQPQWNTWTSQLRSY